MKVAHMSFSRLPIYFTSYFTFISDAVYIALRQKEYQEADYDRVLLKLLKGFFPSIQTVIISHESTAIGKGSNRLDLCKCRSLNFGIDVEAGDIKSPGYPTNYCNNLNCKYEIDTVPGQSIHLSIVSFETERHDSLRIHQTFIFANTQYSACIATLYGKDIGWPSFASSISSGFILKFVTDSTETFGGFRARFNRVNITSPTNSCPKFFHEATNEDKALPSPPTNFAYFAGCAYMLNTSEGHGIKLNLKSLAYKAKFIIYETENYHVPPADHTTSPLFEYDQFQNTFEQIKTSCVSITVETNVNAAKLLHNFLRFLSAGLMEAAPKEIISRTNSILIQIKIMQPDLFPATAHSKFLFEAQFSRTDSPCKCFPRSYTIRIDRPTTLSSPGFPLEYCDKLDCETELRLDKYAVDSTHHNAIIIEIHSFNLEHGSDFVHFLDRSKHSSRYLI
uniref:CUB domain-containing protein n=1 Tax=Wuchereria bancrofti TaxID=6293 RepID=A0A1I8EAC9_WUCBA